MAGSFRFTLDDLIERKDFSDPKWIKFFQDLIKNPANPKKQFHIPSTLIKMSDEVLLAILDALKSTSLEGLDVCRELEEKAESSFLTLLTDAKNLRRLFYTLSNDPAKTQTLLETLATTPLKRLCLTSNYTNEAIAKSLKEFLLKTKDLQTLTLIWSTPIPAALLDALREETLLSEINIINDHKLTKTEFKQKKTADGKWDVHLKTEPNDEISAHLCALLQENVINELTYVKLSDKRKSQLTQSSGFFKGFNQSPASSPVKRAPSPP